MKNIFSNFYRIIILSAIVFVFNFSFINITHGQADLMQKAFQPAMNQQKLIDLGMSKDQVGNEILRKSMTVSVNLKDGIKTESRSPLIVRIAKFLLRITIVLSVTMVIINGVMYIINSSKGELPKDEEQNLMLIAGGILLALSSLGIINLISSISVSSLKTSEDFGFIESNNKKIIISYLDDNIKKGKYING